ncbi:hypothetical protein GCM10009757_21410 [Streptomyces cheonanensis]|uniref:Uncharacterized protein n=1 Tax=Streptomyces cheonanensis TaxID=312720 RepID=A0ABP5GP44_9ACTN
MCGRRKAGSFPGSPGRFHAARHPAAAVRRFTRAHGRCPHGARPPAFTPVRAVRRAAVESLRRRSGRRPVRVGVTLLYVLRERLGLAGPAVGRYVSA